MDLHDLPCFVLLILLLPLSPSKQVGFGWSGLCHFVSNWLSLCHNIDNCSSWPPLTHHFLQGIGISKSAQRRRRATSVLLFLLMFGLDDLTILWCVTGFNAKKGHAGWLRNAQLHNDVWGVWSTKCIGEVQNLHQASCFLSPSFILHNVLVPSETRVGSAWSCHFRILHDLGMPWNVFLSLPLSLYVYMYVDVYNYIIRKNSPTRVIAFPGPFMLVSADGRVVQPSTRVSEIAEDNHEVILTAAQRHVWSFLAW